MSFHVFFPDCPQAHPVRPGFPERSHRLHAARASIEALSTSAISFRPHVAAELIAAASLHTADYLNALSAPMPDGVTHQHLDGGDTIQTRSTLSAALNTLGSAITAVDDVVTEQSHGGFVIGRPPGHHACKGHAMGFCVLGTAALAAKHARERHGLRVAVLDFDLHHGNGTQDLLWDEPDVMLVSTQQTMIWPMSGSTGTTGAHGQILNVGLPKGADGVEIIDVWIDLLDKVKEFAPDLIIVSAGFDAHADDPLGDLQMNVADYHSLGCLIGSFAAENCNGRVVGLLEGGYDLSVLNAAPGAFISGLLKKIAADGDTRLPSAISGPPSLGGSPYLTGNVPIMGKLDGDRFQCVKLNGRLWIQDVRVGDLVYTNPDFITLQSRDPLTELAARFTANGGPDIAAIIEFERVQRRSHGYTKRKSPDFA